MVEIPQLHGVMLSYRARGGLACFKVLCAGGSGGLLQPRQPPCHTGRDAELLHGVQGHPVRLPMARGLGVAAGLGAAMEAAHPRGWGCWGSGVKGCCRPDIKLKGKSHSPGLSF